MENTTKYLACLLWLCLLFSSIRGADAAVRDMFLVTNQSERTDEKQSSSGSIVAQSDGTGAPPVVVPIPPVVSGSVEMEEFKAANVIDLKVAQSRTFKSKNKIIRTSISDPAIAEPVIVAESQ